MTTIRLKRKSEVENKMRNFKILLNGKEIGKISDGELKDFSIEPGKHTLTAKIDWCSSKPLELNMSSNETMYVTVGSYRSSKKLLLFISFVLLVHLVALTFFDWHYLAFLLVPALCYMIYFITFGKKNYLVLKEITI